MQMPYEIKLFFKKQAFSCKYHMYLCGIETLCVKWLIFIVYFAQHLS